MEQKLELEVIRTAMATLADYLDRLEYRIDNKRLSEFPPRERFWHHQEMSSLLSTKRRLQALGESFTGKLLNCAIDAVSLSELASVLKSKTDLTMQESIDSALRLSHIEEEFGFKKMDASPFTQAAERVMDRVRAGKDMKAAIASEIAAMSDSKASASDAPKE
jgi:hypothetical protein